MESNGEKEAPQREVRLKPALLPQTSASVKARSNQNYGVIFRSRYRSNDLPKAQGAIPKQARPSDAPSLPNQSQPVQMDSNQNSRQTFRPLYPSSPLQQAQLLPLKPANEDEDKQVICCYCERKLKEKNLVRHLRLCSMASQPCIYCDEELSTEHMKSHVVLCKKNPDNISKQAPLKSKEAPITLGTLPPRASRSEVSIHADVAPPRMPAERSTGTGARPSSVTHFEACKQNLDNVHTEEYRRHDEETLPGATAQVGCPRTKGALTFCIDPELREVPEDSRVWLQCLSSGNVFAAFAAFEQSCSGKNLSESAMYTQFVFALVDSKLFELVTDILEHPCQTQPLDCLMVALFARVSLPRKMWAKRIQEVTWNDVLKYLPSVLASRVQKKNAMSYLQNYPVFLEERGSSHAIDKFSGTKRNSAEAPQSSNSTKPVSPANDVIPALRFLRPTGHMGSS
ncbi:uncharacterized protein LOC144142519 isoform X2 [Haemaphysalis longicornis]